jgi:hypothetical protein
VVITDADLITIMLLLSAFLFLHRARYLFLGCIICREIAAREGACAAGV